MSKLTKSAKSAATAVSESTKKNIGSLFTTCVSDYNNLKFQDKTYKDHIDELLVELEIIQKGFEDLTKENANIVHATNNNGAPLRYSMGRPTSFQMQYQALHFAYEMYNFLQVFLSSQVTKKIRCKYDLPIFAYAHVISYTDWSKQTVHDLKGRPPCDFDDLKKVLNTFSEEDLQMFKTCLACFDPVARKATLPGTGADEIMNLAEPRLSYKGHVNVFKIPDNEYIKMIDIFYRYQNETINKSKVRFVLFRDKKLAFNNNDKTTIITQSFPDLLENYILSLRATVEGLREHLLNMTAFLNQNPLPPTFQATLAANFDLDEMLTTQGNTGIATEKSYEPVTQQPTLNEAQTLIVDNALKETAIAAATAAVEIFSKTDNSSNLRDEGQTQQSTLNEAQTLIVDNASKETAIAAATAAVKMFSKT